MKKSFTLLELTISITLFLIVVIFLYKSLEQGKYSNEKFVQKQEELLLINNINDIFLEDIAESFGKIIILKDDDNNSIIKFKSFNTYHNAYNNNITYLIGSNNTFIRIESFEEFKLGETLLDFYENSYIDILLKDIEYFEAKSLDDEYLFVIKQKGKKREVFKLFKMGE